MFEQTVQKRNARRMWSFGISVACILILNPAYADDDRFVSDNTAADVRPPVLELPLSYPGPKKIKTEDLDGVTVHQASELKLIASLVNRDTLVVGKVESVYIPDSQNKVILNLGKDYRNCFKIVIDVRDFEKWGTSEPKEIGKLFEGSGVAVDGLVSLHQKKPQIAVTLPHQLRVLE